MLLLLLPLLPETLPQPPTGGGSPTLSQALLLVGLPSQHACWLLLHAEASARPQAAAVRQQKASKAGCTAQQGLGPSQAPGPASDALIGGK